MRLPFKWLTVLLMWPGAGCLLLVNPNFTCTDGGQCAEGDVCNAEGLCVPGSASTASSSSSSGTLSSSSSSSSGSVSGSSSSMSSSSSGSTAASASSSSGSSMSSSSSSSSSGGSFTVASVPGSGRYGAALVSIPSSNTAGSALLTYLIGGSEGTPMNGGYPSGVMVISAESGVSLVDAGLNLVTPRRHAAVAFAGTEILVLGGETSTLGELAGAEGAQAMPGSSPSPFEAASSFDLVENRRAAESYMVPPPMQSGSPPAGMFVIGGLGIDGGVVDTEHLPFTPAHPLTPPFVALAGQPIPRAFGALVENGSYLYLVGGADLPPDGGAPVPNPTVLGAAIFADGGLGPFADAGQLHTARVEPAVFTTQTPGELVVVGGFSRVLGPGGGPPPRPLADIELAALNGDGTLGAFSVATDTLSEARGGAVAAMVGQNVVILGGLTERPDGGLSTTDDVEYGPTVQ